MLRATVTLRVVADTERFADGVARRYRDERILVHWEPRLCIHASRCTSLLPQVFDARSRPWVKIDGASADEIAAVVMECPSGALSFERLDGGPQEKPVQTVIEPQRNGPLYIRGSVRIVDERGDVIFEGTRVALCRCGHSGNKPFCDESHIRVRFRTEPLDPNGRPSG